MKYHVLFRGPLSSCNYACGYCPFAKRDETNADLEGDRRALADFLSWIERQNHCRFGILFTPWGEALIRRWYQDALITLSHEANIDRAAIQTNLSCSLEWVRDCNLDRLALWTTFHPTETTRDHFICKVRRLREWGVHLSVGAVGLAEHLQEIELMRADLPTDVYFWINAYKRTPSYYTDAQAKWLTTIDPYFPMNLSSHDSRGRPCAAGETSFTVDGGGVMRRCHFVGEPIGSIHLPDWEACLRPRTCPNASCGCHIGYVHLKHLKQDAIYGANLLERIPSDWPHGGEERETSESNLRRAENHQHLP